MNKTTVKISSKNMILFEISSAILLMSLIPVALTNHLHYEELQELGASCPPNDSCLKREGGQNSTSRSCSCDPSCSMSGTCCIDSPHLGATEQKESCTVAYGSTRQVYMVSQCDPRWSGSRFFKTRCEVDAKNLRDPLSFAPVTSPSSGVTYKNYFCAMCNNDHLQGILWNIKIDAPGQDGVQRDIEEKELLRRLEYNSKESEWGYVEFSGDFIPIKISFQNPVTVESLVKRCRTDLISQCADSWRYDETSFKCNAYMAAINVPRGGTQNMYASFRNAHCAICNYHSDFANAECDRFDSSFTTFGAPGLSFSLLLDINRSDGDSVGVTNRCTAGRIFDPFFKRCRTLSCGLPGYVLRNRSCVRAV